MINPEFFDIFGIFVFAIILIIGLLIRFKRRKLSDKTWNLISLFLIIIAILGLIVDGIIVWRTYLI